MQSRRGRRRHGHAPPLVADVDAVGLEDKAAERLGGADLGDDAVVAVGEELVVGHAGERVLQRREPEHPDPVVRDGRPQQHKAAAKECKQHCNHCTTATVSAGNSASSMRQEQGRTGCSSGSTSKRGAVLSSGNMCRTSSYAWCGLAALEQPDGQVRG